VLFYHYKIHTSIQVKLLNVTVADILKTKGIFPKHLKIAKLVLSFKDVDIRDHLLITYPFLYYRNIKIGEA